MLKKHVGITDLIICKVEICLYFGKLNDIMLDK
jgi:hypothetical protein